MIIENFINMLMFIAKKDKNEKIYETPTVVYLGKEFSKLNFTYIFVLFNQFIKDKNIIF
jgi:hypothetical protein